MKKIKTPKNFSYVGNLKEFLEKEINNRFKPEELLKDLFTTTNRSNTEARNNVDGVKLQARTYLNELISELTNSSTYKGFVPLGTSSSCVEGSPLILKSITLNSIDIRTVNNADSIRISLRDSVITLLYDNLQYNEDKGLYLIEGMLRNSNQMHMHSVHLIIEDNNDMLYLDLLDETISKEEAVVIKKLKEIEDLNSIISTKKFVSKFMKESKLQTIEISALKTKLVLKAMEDSLEEDGDDDANLLATNINEIISINL